MSRGYTVMRCCGVWKNPDPDHLVLGMMQPILQGCDNCHVTRGASALGLENWGQITLGRVSGQ